MRETAKTEREQTTIRLPAELKEKLQQQGQTLCGLVRQILWDWIKREGQGAAESGAGERERD